MDEKELKIRTKEFVPKSRECVKLTLALPTNLLGNYNKGQLIRNSTSVASNYRSVCNTHSKASFVSKLSIVIEEADEPAFWLNFITDEQLMSK